MGAKTIADHRYELSKRGYKIRKDFPIDHRLMQVPETQKMQALREQIETLMAQYDKLKEAEQKKFWKVYMGLQRDAATDAWFRV